MEERITQLENELRELKTEYYRNNFIQQENFIKDVSFKGRVGFYGEEPQAQASAIAAVGVPSGAYVQSEAQAAVNAINSIRTVLQNLGFTL